MMGCFLEHGFFQRDRRRVTSPGCHLPLVRRNWMNVLQKWFSHGRDARVLLCVGILIAAVLTAGFASVKHITIIADGKTRHLTTTYVRPDRVLQEAGVHVNEKDEVTMTTKHVEDGTEIRVHRAVLVTIEQGDKARIVRTAKQNVGEVLRQHGYDLTKVMPVVGEETPITQDMNIRLVTPEEFEAQRKAELARMEEQRRYIDTSRGRMRYKSMMVMEASAYLPTDGGGAGITATGVRAGHGIAAVDPDVIPLGTRLYIPGYGVAVAADTGGMIEGDMIDLCMEDYGSAIEFGRRDVKVYVLD